MYLKNIERARHQARSIYNTYSNVKCTYRRRDGAPPATTGNLISCPARSSASAVIPFNRATSFASRLRAAAIFEIVSPLRARIFVSAGALFSGAPGLARRQLVRRTLLLGTTNLVVDFRSTPPFIACNCATLTPVRGECTDRGRADLNAG